MNRRARWMSPIDVQRAPLKMVTALGPLALSGDLAHQVAGIIHAGFEEKVFTVPSATSLRWRRVETAPITVREYPPVDRDGLDEVLTQFARDTATSPVVEVGRTGDYLLLSINHSWGDAHLSIRINQLIAERATGAELRQRRMPLLTAIARFFGANRQQAARVVRSRLTAASIPAPATTTTPAETRPWARAPRVVSVSVGIDAVDDIRRWRTDTGTDVSVSAVLFAAAIRELDRAGIAHHPDVRVLFDCRRYLTGLSDPLEVLANFVAGVDFPIPGVPTPADINAMMRTTSSSGRPLLSLAMSSATTTAAILRRSPPAPEVALGTPVQARITYSDVGLVQFTPSVWTGEVPARFFNTLSEPAQPDGLVITFLQAGGALHITASFHDTVFDAETVREALRRTAQQPLPDTALGAHP